MKSFYDLLGELEEAKNAAQQAAIAIAKKEKGEKPKDESMDRDALNKAMAAFKKKGGKVTKVPAAKAQGYHGKDDPGSQVHGVLDRPDTKKFKARKGGKIRSMGSLRNQTEAKQLHMFDNEKDARAKAKEIGGKYVKGKGKSAGKHAAVVEKKLMKGIEVDDDTLRMFKANPKLVPNSAVFRRLDPKTQNAVKKHLGM